MAVLYERVAVARNDRRKILNIWIGILAQSWARASDLSIIALPDRYVQS
jgi:hypothetical protein